jgi:hypothetical protein
MAAKWKDRKRFYTDEKPCASDLETPGCKLCVHGYVGHGPDEWFASSYSFFTAKKLESKTLDEAKKEALTYLEGCIREILEGVQGVEV